MVIRYLILLLPTCKFLELAYSTTLNSVLKIQGFCCCTLTFWFYICDLICLWIFFPTAWNNRRCSINKSNYWYLSELFPGKVLFNLFSVSTTVYDWLMKRPRSFTKQKRRKNNNVAICLIGIEIWSSSQGQKNSVSC